MNIFLFLYFLNDLLHLFIFDQLLLYLAVPKPPFFLFLDHNLSFLVHLFDHFKCQNLYIFIIQIFQWLFQIVNNSVFYFIQLQIFEFVDISFLFTNFIETLFENILIELVDFTFIKFLQIEILLIIDNLFHLLQYLIDLFFLYLKFNMS